MTGPILHYTCLDDDPEADPTFTCDDCGASGEAPEHIEHDPAGHPADNEQPAK